MKTLADHKVPCQYCSKIAPTNCLYSTNCVFWSCEGCVEPSWHREGCYTSHQVHSDIILQSLGKDAKSSWEDFWAEHSIGQNSQWREWNQEPHTGGKVAWKPTKTSWVHCRLWLKVPTTYLLIADWVHSKCSQIMCSTWNPWEHLYSIWNIKSTCMPHLIPHNS